MAKKKSGKEPTKASAKASKKAKAAQKIERKEKKKAVKTKDEFDDDDQDLESILDKVIPLELSDRVVVRANTDAGLVDPTRVGGSTQGHRRACRGTTESTRERYPHPMPEWKPSMVYWRGVLQ